MLTGPIVGHGKLIGTINFARVGNTPAFNTEDLNKLTAVCLHVSACLGNMRSRSILVSNSCRLPLTEREIQIANLVRVVSRNPRNADRAVISLAQGMTNAEIGKELWISQNTVKGALKRMFRKLNVTSRTEMVTRLRDLIV
ncbi:MAG: hypothetical protein Tsb0014_15320 [Pleurocapsa sp.]